MDTIIRRNERSWAIELISEINIMLSKARLKIKKAGGESTLSVNKKSMFPDVLLYADEEQTQILQGWELKLPDTLITDGEYIRDARRKAEALKLNSFFLWNFTHGVLYVKNDTGSFEIAKSWTGTSYIKTRNDVVTYKKEWMPVIKEIILEINSFFVRDTIHTASLTDSLTEHIMTDLIERNKALTAAELKKLSNRDMYMERRLKQWWNDFSKEYMKDEPDLYYSYAKLILLNWINRITFAHIIKGYHNCAVLIEEIDSSKTPAEGNQIISEITSQGDFYNVFQSVEYNDLIPMDTWNDMIDYNRFMTNNGISNIEQTMLQDLLERTVNTAKREIRGQFSTPPLLADFLCQITVRDWTSHCADVSSGTGTIAKAIVNNKMRRLQDVEKTFSTTWVSDKYSYPLQISSIGLTSMKAVNVPVHLFRMNAFLLEPGNEIEIKNPADGSSLSLILPKYSAIASNLPFISSNAIDADEKKLIKEIRSEVLQNTGMELDGKGDIYMYFPFTLHKMLELGGRFGMIVSNAWLGTRSGIQFFEALSYYYHIESVIISGNGRWFQNAEVVTTILILEKKKIAEPSQDEQIHFCLTYFDFVIEDGQEEQYEALINAIVLQEEGLNGLVKIRPYTLAQIKKITSLGISLNALFHGIDWVDQLAPVLIPVNEILDVKRGERRGWNELFYPGADHGIEAEYIKPVLKKPSFLKDYIAHTDKEAFCCHLSLAELEEKGDMGAYAWIKKFEGITNNTGISLPKALKKPGNYWYEMDDNSKADMVTALNPNKRLFISRFEEPTFVDQRFTRLLKKKELDIRITHALLNSLYGMFAIEAVGFGRGLGVLDASSSNFKRIFMLNPELLTSDQQERLLESFKKIESRKVMDLEAELEDDIRSSYDRMVLDFYGMGECYEPMKQSLLSMQKARLSVNL